MIESYKTKSNIGIGLGLLINLSSRWIVPLALPADLVQRQPAILLVLSGIGLIGTVLFIWGCVMYALAKGRNGWWGAFGLLSIIGLIVLVCLKDLAKDGYVADRHGFAPIMPGEGPPTLPPRM